MAQLTKEDINLALAGTQDCEALAKYRKAIEDGKLPQLKTVLRKAWWSEKGVDKRVISDISSAIELGNVYELSGIHYTVLQQALGRAIAME